jgi:hypothetical protein
MKATSPQSQIAWHVIYFVIDDHLLSPTLQ